MDYDLPLGDFSEQDMAVMKSFIEGKDGVYLEVGVKHGKSLAFARRYFKGKVYGIDIKDRADKLDENYDFGDTIFIDLSSNEAAPHWNEKIDVLFIDGDHSYQGVKDDWNNFSPFVKKGGVVVFHDCDEVGPDVVKLSKEVAGKDGWGELVKHKKDGLNTSIASVRREK